MGDESIAAAQNGGSSGGKKHILINAFDMSTVGHLSPGQWKVRRVDNNISLRAYIELYNRTPRIDQRQSASSITGLT